MKKAMTLVVAMIFAGVTGLATAQGTPSSQTPAATKSSAPKAGAKVKKAKTPKKTKKAAAKTS